MSHEVRGLQKIRIQKWVEASCSRQPIKKQCVTVPLFNIDNSTRMLDVEYTITSKYT